VQVAGDAHHVATGDRAGLDVVHGGGWSLQACLEVDHEVIALGELGRDVGPEARQQRRHGLRLGADDLPDRGERHVEAPQQADQAGGGDLGLAVGR
jgi:hypothetical protein